jgi:hypothetical protein
MAAQDEIKNRQYTVQKYQTLEKRMRYLLEVSALLVIFSMATSEFALAEAMEEWIAQYNGTGDGSDYAKALAVDLTGNVYVTGGSLGSNGTYDYATIKYDSSGEELWVMCYNGPGNGNDVASALAVDATGNVYVTGYSRATAGLGSLDYATIKYDSSGNEIWVARYNGPGNGDDQASALSVDATGNVYVTGYSRGSAGLGSLDYATIKYDSSGNEIWAARYNGPGNEDDQASALAVDPAGNVYVTGGSSNGSTISSYDSYDYATIKYDSSGNEIWVARYNGPSNGHDQASALAVNATGNVYVTGGIDGFTYYMPDAHLTIRGFCTIKYDSSGEELWVARYNGPGNGDDYASALAIDVGGNVYVTGGSVGSDGTYDYATIKYDSSGNEVWAARYNGLGNGDDQASALAVDAVDNVYVTGGSINRLTGSYLSYDFATIKYDSSGDELWAARYNGPGNGDDYAFALAVDAGGNVYVTGHSLGSVGLSSLDYATIKLEQDEGDCRGGHRGGCFITIISN